MPLLKSALLSLSGQRGVYRFVMRHNLLRAIAWRYVAGEDLDDGIAVAQALNSQGLKVTLDHLGESVRDARAATRAAEDYVQAIQAIQRERLDANVSLKLTQMGLDVSPDLCRQNLERVVDCGRAAGDIFVRIDMESSAYTQRTLDMHQALWESGRRNVGVVLQAYLYRTQADVERQIALGARVRLCKGAYLEPAEVAWPLKADVDAQYARLAEPLLLRGVYPAFATHDERRLRHIQGVARRNRIPPERFELQMLFGVRRDLQLRLAAQGYNVRVYVPYGRQWYPYLTRRLAERPANLAFFLRSMAQEALAERH